MPDGDKNFGDSLLVFDFRKGWRPYDVTSLDVDLHIEHSDGPPHFCKIACSKYLIEAPTHPAGGYCVPSTRPV